MLVLNALAYPCMLYGCFLLCKRSVRTWILVYKSKNEAETDVGVFKNPCENLKRTVGTPSRQRHTHADTHFAMNFESVFLVPVNFRVYGPQGQENPQLGKVLPLVHAHLLGWFFWALGLFTEVHKDPRNILLGFILWSSFRAE